MRETSKGNLYRRFSNEIYQRAFKGVGIDVGPGDDPLTVCKEFPGIESIKTFDLEDGDANELDRYFEPSSFDFLFSSNCLEHMHKPTLALRSWAKAVKSGGWIVFSVPDFKLYEYGKRLPSVWNPDHKTTWGFHTMSSPGVSHGVFEIILRAGLIPHLIQLCDTKYDYSVRDKDQTFPENGAEAFIEAICRKP